ncbi:hypothetical protein L484_025609 [Morus notabilis]|uniref:DUF4283 domain-containing protein n=1 Tax=Morus notabilis TaxID=981085 RepID=W9R8Q9_9ROSA|nr:hypothetical protein L484_025609 [Morus notabilis]
MDSISYNNIPSYLFHYVYKIQGIGFRLPTPGDVAYLGPLIHLKLYATPAQAVVESVTVGKVFSSQIFRLSTLHSILAGSWHGIKGWTIRDLESSNTFAFYFRNGSNKYWVFDRRAWTINGAYLLICNWPPATPVDRIQYNLSTFLHQFHGISVEFFSKENAFTLAQNTRDVLDELLAEKRKAREEGEQAPVMPSSSIPSESLPIADHRPASSSDELSNWERLALIPLPATSMSFTAVVK